MVNTKCKRLVIYHSAFSIQHFKKMGKKNKKNRIGVVFSTNPDHEYEYEKGEEEKAPTGKDKQVLRVMIDRKKRRGKEVTLVTGYKGNPQTLKEIGKMLKTKCGVGGSVKDYEIIIQGNHKTKIIEILLKEGYSQTKGVGGN